MDESFNYNEHFEKKNSPAVSDVSPHPILEFYRESWREKRSGIENADLIDDAQSKLQSVGQNSQMEKESDIITNVKGSDSLLASAELLDKSLASTLIGGLKGFEPKLQSSFELLDKVLAPTLILEGEGSESMLLDAAEFLNKSLAPTSNRGLEGYELKLQGSVELVDKVLPSTMILGGEGSKSMLLACTEVLANSLPPTSISGLEGYDPKLQGSVEIVEKVLPTMILGGEGSESMLQASVELLDKSLALTSISGLEGGFESMLLASAKLFDKSLAPISISRLEGFVPNLQGSLEHVKEVLTPSLIQGAEVTDSMLMAYAELLDKSKAGHRNGLYRYHSGPFRYHFGPFRSGSIRDGMGYIEPVHGTERYHDLVPVYRYRFIPIHSGSVPVRSGTGPVPVNHF
ncbi:hypothetical protein MTR67_024092 [Solanum verrucosum]|uniref:Uncharacterized protein n=1 Tax=Solanum verrucosum TaxID=315347 RepID=A0AAF0QY58_SOLVR|nr:hypothetical protein MTR67_024092 [Solanum verrucosum]